MKRFLFLMMMIGCVNFVSPVHAYDEYCVPNQYTTPCFDKCCECKNFQGLYVGGNVGWACHDFAFVDKDAWVDEFFASWAIGTAATTNDALTAGIQIGYNYQCGCSLLGLEVDASWANLDKSKLYSPITINDSGQSVRITSLTIKDQLEWFGTIRGRAGVIANNLLLFASAGAAWANFEQRWEIENYFGFDPTTFERFSSRKVQWGLALGVGVEWMMSSNLSIKAEGLYLKFPERTASRFSPSVGEIMHFDLLNAIWIARIGFNYNLCGLASWFR